MFYIFLKGKRLSCKFIQPPPYLYYTSTYSYPLKGMHETSARAWCTGKTQRSQVEREVGGGIGMGNTCKSMADSCQCMAKPTAMLLSN